MPVKHAVFLRLKPETPANVVREFFQTLAAFDKHVPGMKDFSGGPYSSPEGFNKGYTHGFVMTFADEASRDTYLTHPEHDKVKAFMLPWIAGGLEGVIAVDWLA
jgi:hypothetical protein